ncbi:MAG: 50S ribosomal protein L1, partial [Candidatus Aenigmatarchaeota archaeon]
MKKPENRFSFDFQLPAGRGKKTKIAFIGDALYNDAKGVADVVISKAEIERYGKDRKALKKLAKECDTFMAEAPLMPLVGKSLGIVLGTRGKMPMPVPPKIKVEGMIAAARNYVRVSLRNSPVVQVPIGSEKMGVEDIEKNFEAVVNAVKERLPKGVNNIRATYIKLTMGKPIKVEI